jgi:hypothetical protein
MKIKILLFLIATLMFFSGYGQTTFEKLLDSGEVDFPCRVIQTKDSCFVWASYTLGPTLPFNIFLVKLNELGDTVWAKTYHDTKSIRINALIETTDGDLLLAGARQVSTANLDFYLMKFDSDGDSIVFKTFGGAMEDVAFDVVAGNNSYTLIGSASSYSSHVGSGYNCIYMLTTDLNGDSLWDKKFEPLDYNLAYQIRQLDNGDFVFPSLSNYAGLASDYCSFILRTDSLGNLKWSKPVVGDTAHIGFNSIQVLPNQDFIFGGMYQKTDGVRHAILYRTDSNGNAIWCKNYFSTILSGIGAIDACTDGSIIACGYKAPSSKFMVEKPYTNDPKWYKCSFLLMKINAQGDTIWTREYSPAYSNLGNSIVECYDGGLIMIGTAQNSDATNKDIYLLKTTGNGLISGISNQSYPAEFVLYPNPSGGRISILCEECKPNLTYKLINISGEVVQSGH